MTLPTSPHLVTVDPPEDQASAELRERLRDAIDIAGWKREALAAELGFSGGAYLSKMLLGEKPIAGRYLFALPVDVQTVFAQRWAESLGLIVVKPSYGAAAVRDLVAGLYGVLLGARAGGVR